MLLGNLWIWKALIVNPLIALVMFSSTICLYNHKRMYLLFVLTFTATLVLQFLTTNITSLTSLDNDQKRIQSMRLEEYPPVKINLFDKTLWLPVAHWYEGRKESIAFFRIITNFSENIDPNLYFFANHPRQRVGIQEFEKFPYILLPIFLMGILISLKSWKKEVFFISLFIPLFVLSLIGNNNSLGPFVLFPFLAVAISFGLEKFRKFKKGSMFLLLFWCLLIINLIQILSYAIYK